MDNYVFSFDDNDDSLLISQIINGKYKGKNIFLSNDGQQASDLLKDKIESLLEYINEKRLRISQVKVDALIDAVKNEESPYEDKVLKEIYTNFMRELKKNNEVKLDDSEMQAMPSEYKEGERDCIYICGCSGSGKSTWISQYALSFNKMFPKAPIFFISAKNMKDDKAYSKVKNIKQLSLEIDQLEEITIDGKAYDYFVGKELSLVIFDDAEALNKEQQKYVDLILESILQIGRSKNIYCIVSRHVLNNGIKTKVIFNECSKIVVFPNGISRYQLLYTFKNYLGLDKHQIQRILNVKSRWVLVHNHLPRYVLSQREIFLL
jgi:hypothetical protein